MEWLAQLMQTWGAFIQTIRFTDILDVAVIAYLVYRLMLFASRSSTANVAKAILVLVVALWVSDVCQLHVVNFILGRALELGFLALVVIFQPELRRLLEQLGSNKLKHLFMREEAATEIETAIDQTVAAYTALSKDKVGALMVFERKNLLDDAIATGTALDCSVNAELLKNLFWNKAPLHDGAVIVQNDRISAARCIMPVSDRRDIPGSMGLRHRAALGISGLSDAYVVVVSEETGNITFFKDGLYKVRVAPEELKRFLCGDFTTFVTK